MPHKTCSTFANSLNGGGKFKIWISGGGCGRTVGSAIASELWFESGHRQFLFSGNCVEKKRKKRGACLKVLNERYLCLPRKKCVKVKILHSCYISQSIDVERFAMSPIDDITSMYVCIILDDILKCVYASLHLQFSLCTTVIFLAVLVIPLNMFVTKKTSFSWKEDTILTSVTSKKSPNVYKSCPKMISLEKLKILTLLQKLPKNVGDLAKLIVAKGF